MRYVTVTESNIGIEKRTNQDSVLVKHAIYGNEEIVMAIVCDGMGGLSKGELASATVVREFDDWFTKELHRELKVFDADIVGNKWILLLKRLNVRIQEYGKEHGEKLGTTFTGVLFVNNQLVAVHVGDTRLYYIDNLVEQMTEDHTFVAREVLSGRLTLEQARTDKRRHTLLQCVGASKMIEPQIICEEVKQGIYMLCSDGFRNRLTEKEVLDMFGERKMEDENQIKSYIRQLVELTRKRGEKDDISVILIKVNGEKRFIWKDKGRFNGRLSCDSRRYQVLGVCFLITSIVMLILGLLYV